MKQRAGLVGGARSMGWKLALVAGFAPSVAWGQDCQEDADCGHGFQCIHESGGTSSVTGVGGSMQAECGDGICEFGAEDIESCPEDCDTLQYCAPAECDSNSDCAEGYECGEEIGSNSSFTSAGGSSSSVCGDGTCDFDENNASCPDDCAIYRLCQPIQMTCSTDADCAEGFYCYLGVSENVSSVGFSSVDSGTSGSDTASADSGSADSGSADSSSADSGSADSSSGNTDAGTGGTDGFAPPADTTGTSGGDETGVCVAEASDSGGSAVNVGTSGNTDGGASGPTGTTGAEDDTSGGQSASGAVNGAGGASAVAGNGSPATSGSDGDATGSDGEASGSNDTGTGSGSDAGGAGSDPDASGDSDDDGGCSCSVLGVPGSSGLFGAVLFGLVAGIRRRRARA